MIKVCAYLRVSGAEQTKGDGLERSGLAISSYCAAHGMTACVFAEPQAISGTVEGMDRPAWFAMLAEMKETGIKIIIVESLQRLARALMIQEHIIADLQRLGITLISTREPDLGSDDPERVLFRQIMGAIHEYDRKMIVLKLRGARQRKKAATGRCEGRLPFGCHPQHPREQSTLITIKKMRDNGLTFRRIANLLNQDAIPPRHALQWTCGSVHAVLKHGKVAA